MISVQASASRETASGIIRDSDFSRPMVQDVPASRIVYVDLLFTMEMVDGPYQAITGGISVQCVRFSSLFRTLGHH